MEQTLLPETEEDIKTGVYPCLLPSYRLMNGALYWGNEPVAALTDEELLFLLCCDGELEIGSIAHGVAETEELAERFGHLLVNLPPPPEPLKKSGGILIISPHGYEAYLAMGGSMRKWAEEGRLVCHISCFSQQTAVRSGFDGGTPAEMNALRRDEAGVCARLCGITGENLNYPDHNYARQFLFPENFEENYKSVSAALKAELFTAIYELNPAQVYIPAGLSGYRDGKLVHELLLDFYKQEAFPGVEFFTYDDFPYAVKYQSVDDFELIMDACYVQTRDCFEEVAAHAGLKQDIYRAYGSLFDPLHALTIDHLLKRNALWAGRAAGKYEHFCQLTTRQALSPI